MRPDPGSRTQPSAQRLIRIRRSQRSASRPAAPGRPFASDTMSTPTPWTAVWATPSSPHRRTRRRGFCRFRRQRTTPRRGILRGLELPDVPRSARRRTRATRARRSGGILSARRRARGRTPRQRRRWTHPQERLGRRLTGWEGAGGPHHRPLSRARERGARWRCLGGTSTPRPETRQGAAAPNSSESAKPRSPHAGAPGREPEVGRQASGVRRVRFRGSRGRGGEESRNRACSPRRARLSLLTADF